MQIEQIKKRFESKSYSERMDFINEYDFKDSFKEYYYNFIRNNLNKVKDPYYLSELIDLSGYLKFDEIYLYKQIFRLLKHESFIVKLSVFDYLKRIDRFYIEKTSERKILNYISHLKQRRNKGKYFLIFMSYQLLLQLSIFKNKKLDSIKYFELFSYVLKVRGNSAMVWRAYKDSRSEPLLSKYQNEINQIVLSLNEEYNYGHEILPM